MEKSSRIIRYSLFACAFTLCLSCFVPVCMSSSCEECHRGIESISEEPSMKGLSCSFCHKGDPDAPTKEGAHEDMWANPSDYRVAKHTCGQCHGQILERSQKSLHATSAGIISATRYTWAAQNTRSALYANYEVRDDDGVIPKEKGALPGLKTLPSFDPNKPDGMENSPADDYLREECLRCHIYSYGAERPGDYRASGCAACHMPYADDGIYRGADKAIGKHGPVARPRFHRITRLIPPEQCIHCHNRGGRTGVSFIGTMESDGYGSPWSTRPGQKGGEKLHGKYYNHLSPDVHYEKGLYCIDCHTEQDCHGDGNIYGKKEEAVEIECQDCHGTPDAQSILKTSWGNPMKSLKQVEGKIVLTSVTGKEYVVPQVKDVIKRGPASARSAMGLSSHMKRLECYACHCRWAPQCYGCHAQQDCGEPSHDWLRYRVARDPSRAGKAIFREQDCFKWRETRSYLRWEEPALGINSEGKVAPFIPGCQVIFTQIGPDGKVRAHNKVFTTYDGLYGIATNPIQPHTVSRKARTCESCHANPKALGLGSGIYDSRANGLALPFELEQIVTIDGKQLQATSHDGARPFNRKELMKMRRVDICAACHKYMEDPSFWKDVERQNGLAPDDKIHSQILGDLLKSSVGGNKDR